MGKFIIVAVLLFGLVAAEFLYKFPAWVYKTNHLQIDNWTCTGVEIKLSCPVPNKGAVILIPQTCTYLCLGKSTHRNVEGPLRELEFYENDNGFLNIFK